MKSRERKSSTDDEDNEEANGALAISQSAKIAKSTQARAGKSDDLWG